MCHLGLRKQVPIGFLKQELQERSLESKGKHARVTLPVFSPLNMSPLLPGALYQPLVLFLF